MGKSRPRSGRPPGRRGKGGVGPGPGYRPGGTGKGTTHKSSAGASAPVVGIALALIGAPLLIALGVVLFLAHGYGVI